MDRRDPRTQDELMKLAAVALLLAAAGCTSAERRAVVTPASSPPAQETAVPQLVTDRIETLKLTITAEPAAVQAGAGPRTLRSLELEVQPSRREPHARWPDGTPGSADAPITTPQAKALLRVLEQHRYFATAGRYHSERRSPPHTARPAGSQDGLPPRSAKAHVRLSVTVHDDDWHRYFIRDLDWAKDSRELIEHLRDQLQGPAVQLIDQLLLQLSKTER
jgi:hypothetical protein